MVSFILACWKKSSVVIYNRPSFVALTTLRFSLENIIRKVDVPDYVQNSNALHEVTIITANYAKQLKYNPLLHANQISPQNHHYK